MSTQTRPFVLGPGRGTRVRNPVGGDLVFKLEGSQCGDATNVLETEAAPGEGPPLHFHETQDEWLYVLDGTFRFRLNDEVVPAPAGTFVFIPHEVPHSGRTSASGPAACSARSCRPRSSSSSRASPPSRRKRRPSTRSAPSRRRPEWSS